MQQLAWLFSSPACFTCVPALAVCQSQVTREFQPRVSASLHNLEHFFILSHSLPLYDSHLNTGLLIAKIQANLVWNKANKMVDKIQPYNGKRCFLLAKATLCILEPEVKIKKESVILTTEKRLELFFFCWTFMFCLFVLFCWERKRKGERFMLLGHKEFVFFCFLYFGHNSLASFPFFPLTCFSPLIFTIFFASISSSSLFTYVRFLDPCKLDCLT